MKLLFDQNISFRILKKLKTDFPKVKQVKKLGLQNNTDKQIWNFALKNNFTIVTYDGDFCDIAEMKGHPPKIIWIRSGNKTTDEIAQLLIEKKELIKDFIESEEYKDWAVLEIV